MHVLGHAGRIERLISGPLVHTLSAAAGQAQRANVVGAIGTIGPRDAELPRTLLVGNRRGSLISRRGSVCSFCGGWPGVAQSAWSHTGAPVHAKLDCSVAQILDKYRGTECY